MPKQLLSGEMSLLFCLSLPYIILFQICTCLWMQVWIDCGAHIDTHMTSGMWFPVWKHQHINVLELRAVQLALWSSNSELLSVVSSRQHYSCSMHQQTGGKSFSVSMKCSSRDCIMVCKEQCLYQSQVSPWQTECFSGLPLEKEQCCQNRMDLESISTVSGLQNMGNASYQPVCNLSQEMFT